MDLSFYKDKKVLITGHTGFKGTWLSRILIEQGADVIGYSLEPVDNPSFFDMSKNALQMKSIIGDVLDIEKLQNVFNMYQPEIVFHMAAQPLVRLSYEKPVETYNVNVMGTVHILECVRKCTSVKSFINITTDKVYFNQEIDYGYVETDRLDGYDPYSNSKSCSELVTGSYKNAFFKDRDIAISTVRSGNVIGGGDFAKDRIIPDCYRSASENKPIIVRNPNSTRPYQHVLETLRAYLLIAIEQYEDMSLAGAYNVGPNDQDTLMTGNLVQYFCEAWGDNITWKVQQESNPVHEARLLKLDHTKITNVFGWEPIWDAKEAVYQSIAWYKAYISEADIRDFMRNQIKEYFELC